MAPLANAGDRVDKRTWKPPRKGRNQAKTPTLPEPETQVKRKLGLIPPISRPGPPNTFPLHLDFRRSIVTPMKRGIRCINGKFFTMYQTAIFDRGEAEALAVTLRRTNKYEAVKVVKLQTYRYAVYVF